MGLSYAVLALILIVFRLFSSGPHLNIRNWFMYRAGVLTHVGIGIGLIWLGRLALNALAVGKEVELV
jgi:hypothetical protein